MRDLKIVNQGDTYDLEEVDGDLVHIEGNDETIQHVEYRLQVWFAESVYDRTKGFPYEETVFGIEPIEGVVSLLILYISESDGVSGVKPLEDGDVSLEDQVFTISPTIILTDLSEVPLSTQVGA